MKKRTDNSIADIARWVSAGHTQSAGNCRVLLDKIEEQGREITRLKTLLQETGERTRLYIDATGDVGMGTATPSAKLTL